MSNGNDSKTDNDVLKDIEVVQEFSRAFAKMKARFGAPIAETDKDSFVVVGFDVRTLSDEFEEPLKAFVLKLK